MTNEETIDIIREKMRNQVAVKIGENVMDTLRDQVSDRIDRRLLDHFEYNEFGLVWYKVWRQIGDLINTAVTNKQ